jgi:hypothetical protein
VDWAKREERQRLSKPRWRFFYCPSSAAAPRKRNAHAVTHVDQGGLRELDGVLFPRADENDHRRVRHPLSGRIGDAVENLIGTPTVFPLC